MKWKHTLTAGAIISALAAGGVLAQSVIFQDLTGNECWNAGEGPGGPSAFLCANVLRNSAAQVTATPTGIQTFGVAPYASLTYGGNVLMPVQPVAVVTLIAPANPVPNGAKIGMCNVSGSNFATTNIAMTANTGQTFNSAISTTTLAAVTCVRYQFNRANTTWYRIQ